jgi:N-acetylglutamate synthase-like GNAT family acetyltransferase
VRLEIAIKRFELDSDLPILNDWLRARGAMEVDEAGVPAIGFICFEGGVAVCAAFLRRCEGNMGFIEGMASNPEVPGIIRHYALDALTERICREAVAREMTTLLAWSVDTSTLVRSARHGFKQLQQTLISKDLRLPRLAN